MWLRSKLHSLGWVTDMSNYPDGMTSAHWAYLDGEPDSQESECECDLAGTDYCTCDSQEMTAEDIALEGAGL